MKYRVLVDAEVNDAQLRKLAKGGNLWIYSTGELVLISLTAFAMGALVCWLVLNWPG